MADTLPLAFERDLAALHAHVADHGVDDAAVKLANTVDDRFVALLGLTPFEHGILALIGQQLGQAGVAPDDVRGDAPVESLKPDPGIAGALLAAVLRWPTYEPAWVRRYVAFQAAWWRP